MPVILRRFIIIFAVAVFMLFLVLIIAAWSLGAFDTVQISESQSGSFYFIVLDQTSGYRDIPVTIERIKNSVQLPPDIESQSGALIFSNPLSTPLNEVQVKGGIIIPDSVFVPTPLQLIKLDKRLIVSATLEANPSIAIFKTYPALAEWLRKNDRTYKIQLPFVERYYPDNTSVEMTVVPLK